jgi:hypothetical protein
MDDMSATPIRRIAVPLIVVAAAAGASLPFASQLFHGAWLKDAAHETLRTLPASPSEPSEKSPSKPQGLESA